MNINATLIGQSITFFIFVWFCMKYVWPPVMQALEGRRKEIADGLAAGERGKNELTLSSKRAAENLREAKQKASEIVVLAEKRAAEIIDEAKGQAKIEGDRIIKGAQAIIEQETHRAKEILRAQVADLAVAGAARILRREINAKAHDDLLKAIQSEL